MTMLLPPGSPLVMATHNAGKVREIAQLLRQFDLQVSSAAAHNLPEPDETGDTFAANSEIKARATMEATGLAALADDSGLAVPLLGGAPGIYSARWAGESKDFTVAMNRVRDELLATGKPESDWKAYFICDLCLCLPNGAVHHFEGRINGHLEFPPRGDMGFGYDPIFVPEKMTQTFAQIPLTEKQAISHRARAFVRLVEAING